MATATKYAGTITQTTGGKYATFNNLNNISIYSTDAYSTTNTIKGKNSSPNRPSTLTLTNFGFNLPTGAEVKRIEVDYRHKKTGSCHIPAPTITLLGTGNNTFTSKGAAPTTGFITRLKGFTADKVTRAMVNSSNFGVKIDYPTNTNSSEGTLTVSFIRIRVEYVVPDYSLSLNKASGGYNGEDYVIEASISNKNLTSYNPTLTLSAPAGFSYIGSTGTGTATMVNARTVTWDPKLTKNVGTSTIQFKFSTDVTYPTGTSIYTGTFTLVESLNSTTKNYTTTITPQPTQTSSETEDVEYDPSVVPQEDLTDYLTYKVPVYITGSTTPSHDPSGDTPFFDITDYTDVMSSNGKGRVTLNSNRDIKIYNDGSSPGWTNITAGTAYVKTGTNNPSQLGGPNWEFWLRSDVPQTVTISLLVEDNPYGMISDEEMGYLGWRTRLDVTFIVKFMLDKDTVDGYDTPVLTVLRLSDEETHRLGDGVEYIVQSFLKDLTDDNQTIDLYKNNRIGVYNNEILDTVTSTTSYEDLTLEEIFLMAEYWSDDEAGPNSYDSVECEFAYNDDYPVYIIMSGEYTEVYSEFGLPVGTLSFTEPCIIEKAYYQGREANGNYPQPILELIDYDSGADSSTIELGGYATSTPVLVYNLPLNDGYGTGEDLAVRGVQVRANIEATDELVVNAKLISPNGVVGQRSIILEPDDDKLVVGDLGDLWGFNTIDMRNLEEWEVEISTSNILSDSTSTLVYDDVQIVFWVEPIIRQEVSIIVEGEDLAYYGVFIEKVDIPEGLNTNTSFLNIDGTDTNDAYRQNIKEKTITLEFNIDSCDLKTSTDMLRQLAKLLVNEKDEYNRPIPNRIEFSHYPDDYFEYIMEETLEVESDVTGYNVKAKLTVPAGTSYTKEDTVTNTVGFVQGLAAVNPEITFSPSNENIEVRETNSEQSFNMGYSGDWNGKVVLIDCDNRRVYLIDGEDKTDISKYVDHNADWFRLYGAFTFEGINCTIRTVSFNERW